MSLAESTMTLRSVADGLDVSGKDAIGVLVIVWHSEGGLQLLGSRQACDHADALLSSMLRALREATSGHKVQ